MAVADTKVPLFKGPFWHFQIKLKFRKKTTRQGSVRLPDADFWIIPCILAQCFISTPPVFMFSEGIEMEHWARIVYTRRTAVIMMALSRKPNPTKGTELQKPTK